MVGRPQRYEEFYSGTVRYGIFAKSRYTGIFRYGISLIFSYQDFFWKLFGILWYFFIGAISDQFRHFSQLTEILYIRKVPKKHFFVITIKFLQLEI